MRTAKNVRFHLTISNQLPFCPSNQSFWIRRRCEDNLRLWKVTQEKSPQTTGLSLASRETFILPLCSSSLICSIIWNPHYEAASEEGQKEEFKRIKCKCGLWGICCNLLFLRFPTAAVSCMCLPKTPSNLSQAKKIIIAFFCKLIKIVLFIPPPFLFALFFFFLLLVLFFLFIILLPFSLQLSSLPVSVHFHPTTYTIIFLPSLSLHFFVILKLFLPSFFLPFPPSLSPPGHW